MIKIIIADDLSMLRQGIQVVLETDSEIKVCALASNGREAFELCKEHNPDVVLMDMRMPEFDGAYGTRLIKENYPETKVLVLTTFDDDETVTEAMGCGADGYILKEMESEKIIQAVKAVSSGIKVFGANVYSGIQKKITESPKPEHNTENEAIAELSPREREIMVLIAEGLDNKNIAAKLFLAEGTVRNNISRMLDKLGLKDRTQLAVYAVKNNIV
ncbi:response regulator transcription factor [Ruminococcus sp. HUN007]|uniref:response regulator n=1 Tax=Ruminococcus sp. HUN007 TaxID=1514668 RepID=UPI0005D1CA75|nr:response regulator transcription factor [Ruminococcus sp. HUN007]